ncbi:MAG: hypothetical protein JW700_00730 [Candidatus Aenigmarchaeota archaeon]|nr:hypothetical protein [Candidatus Aenigmarchaeota archaeon]
MKEIFPGTIEPKTDGCWSNCRFATGKTKSGYWVFPANPDVVYETNACINEKNLKSSLFEKKKATHIFGYEGKQPKEVAVIAEPKLCKPGRKDRKSIKPLLKCTCFLALCVEIMNTC